MSNKCHAVYGCIAAVAKKIGIFRSACEEERRGVRK